MRLVLLIIIVLHLSGCAYGFSAVDATHAIDGRSKQQPELPAKQSEFMDEQRELRRQDPRS